MLANAITQGSGTYEVLETYPSPVVLIALPLRENPALGNAALIEMCLHEIKMTYPRINSFAVSYEQTQDFGPVLQIIVR